MNKNKLNEEMLIDLIDSIDYATMGKKTTLCLITLHNGFEIVGHSACVDVKNFDANIGKRIAYESAFDKLWLVEGYRLNAELYKDSKSE